MVIGLVQQIGEHRSASALHGWLSQCQTVTAPCLFFRLRLLPRCWGGSNTASQLPD